MKIIKKLLIIIPSVVLGIFLILLLTPILFKGKILEIAKKELNRMLTAKVEFSDLKLSFIRHFPDAYVALEDLTVTCTGEFEGETLVAFKTFSVTVDLKSVIKMDNIRVKSILLDHPKINGHISENGNTNWNIVKPKEETPPPDVPPEEKPPVETAPEKTDSALKIALNKLEIRKADISFQDDASKMTATANDLNFLLNGDMTLDNVDLHMKLNIADVNLWLGGIRMLKNTRVGLVSTVAADLKNMGFTLKENRFNLDDVILKFAGSAQMPGSDINLDMTFAAEKTDFKSVLQLVPAAYMKDFEKVQTSGSFNFSGDIKGTFNNKQMPSASVNLAIDNAMFKYPDLPKSVDNINIKLNAYYDGVVFDRTTLDLDKLHFEMAGNPFDAEAHVKTPQSDMQVAAVFLGKIDFGSLLDVIPLDDMSIRGLLDCDFSLAGRMSALEKKQYEDFDAKGTLKLSGIDFKTPSFPQAIKISNAQLTLSPRRVELANFSAIIGSSDIALNGMLENFIPYVFKGSTVSGNLSLKSDNINLNEFMSPKEGEKPKEAENPEDASPMSVIEVPKNIDFSVRIDIANLLFDKLKITDTVGALLVKDGKLQMQNLALNALDGSIVLSGEYNTQNVKLPSVNLNANIRQVDVESAISSFEILQKILPQPQNYAGKVSTTLTMSSVLDEHLSPVLNTVTARGQLQTHSLKIQNSELFATMANTLKNEAWRTPTLNNVNIRYEVKDGRLSIEPVRISVAQTALELSGGQGLDMTLDYKVNATVPVAAVGTGATDILSKIPGGSRIREFKVTGLIGGTIAKPVVTLGVADMVSTVTETVKEAVREAVKEQVQQVKQMSKEELERQIAAGMAEAERYAQNIRNTAKAAADRVRAETDANANRIEAAAKTPLEKAGAKIAADKARSEGYANAARIEQDADRQATALMDAARKQADELRKN